MTTCRQGSQRRDQPLESGRPHARSVIDDVEATVGRALTSVP
ncbi:MAG: hypothetical protein QOI81_636 [Actinomycetota bacterium]|jgi:hypothetical protein|nr:hypothetical protein [Actinomycetota bacterium]